MKFTRFNTLAGLQGLTAAHVLQWFAAFAACMCDPISRSEPKSLPGHLPNPAREFEQGPDVAFDLRTRGVLPNAQVYSAAVFNFADVLFGGCPGVVALVLKSPSAGRPVYFSPVTPRLVGGHAS